jgi:hypothetical protein
MEASRRDATDEWVLSEHARPPSVKELEARIDVAMSRARSAETAAGAIGATALDAVEQARRCAEAAERTHKLVDERLGSRGPTSSGPAEPSLTPPGSPASSLFANGPGSTEPGTAKEAHMGAAGELGEPDSMRAFIARADRISLRLQRLQGTPLSAAR